MIEMPLIPEFGPDEWHIKFRPSLPWSSWIMKAFCDHESDLFNEDHHHLDQAEIGILFATMVNESKGKRIIGRAQLGDATGSDAWSRGIIEQQRIIWFGDTPDFIITLDAEWIRKASTLERCALIEHELYHCAHGTDRHGVPAFQANGKPKWAMAPHDIEEFTGVVRRYGAYSDEIRKLADAANKKSVFDSVTIDGLCGTCKRVM